MSLFTVEDEVSSRMAAGLSVSPVHFADCTRFGPRTNASLIMVPLTH